MYFARNRLLMDCQTAQMQMLDRHGRFCYNQSGRSCFGRVSEPHGGAWGNAVTYAAVLRIFCHVSSPAHNSHGGFPISFCRFDSDTGLSWMVSFSCPAIGAGAMNVPIPFPSAVYARRNGKHARWPCRVPDTAAMPSRPERLLPPCRAYGSRFLPPPGCGERCVNNPQSGGHIHGIHY